MYPGTGYIKRSFIPLFALQTCKLEICTFEPFTILYIDKLEVKTWTVPAMATGAKQVCKRALL